MKILTSTIKMNVCNCSLIIFLLVIFISSELYVDAAYGDELNEKEAAKVISIVRNTDYLIGENMSVFGYKGSIFGGFVSYVVDEFPNHAHLSKNERYIVNSNQYQLSENNFLNSSCVNEIDHVCLHDKTQFVKINKGGTRDVNKEIISQKYLRNLDVVDEEIVELLMEISSRPFLDLLEVEQKKVMNKKEKSRADEFILSLPNNKKTTSYQPLAIGHGNVFVMGSPENKYIIKYCGLVDNSCAYGADIEVSDLVNKSSNYKLKIIQGPIA